MAGSELGLPAPARLQILQYPDQLEYIGVLLVRHDAEPVVNSSGE